MNNAQLTQELSAARDAALFLNGYLERGSDAAKEEAAKLLAAINNALAIASDCSV